MKFLADLFPILLFFIAYKFYDIYVATAVAIVAAAVQVGYLWLRYRKVEKMQLITLGLLAVFGGMTLLLHDPLFIKWKPTVVNWLFAVAFLASPLFGGKSLTERMMSHAVELPTRVWGQLNLAWATFFIAMGLLNLYVAFNFSEDTWVDFKLFGMTGLTLLFVIGQGFFLTKYINDPPAPAASEER
jgi:intracellular septation protein